MGPLLLGLLWAAQSPSPDDLMRLGRSALAAGRFAEAIEQFERARGALPGHPGVLLNLCIAYQSARRPAEALAACRQVRGQAPELLPARLFEGMALAALGRPREAVGPLETFTRAMPKQAVAWFELANAQLAADNGPAALAAFERLRELEPASPKAWQGIGLSHRRLAEQIFASLPKGSAGWQALAGIALMDQGQPKKAFALLRRALALDASLPGVHLAIAEIYRAAGHADWAATEQAAEQAREPAQTAASGYTRALAHAQAAAEAFEHLSQLPPSAARDEVQAEAARARGRFQESLEWYEKALAVAPGDTRLEAERARALFLVRDFERALPLLRQWGLHYETGLVMLEQGDVAGAARELAQAKEAGARGPLGEAYLRLEQPARAIPHLVAAAAGDTDGRWHLLLGRAYQRTGQAGRAQEAQRQYQRLSAAGTEAPAEITPP